MTSFDWAAQPSVVSAAEEMEEEGLDGGNFPRKLLLAKSTLGGGGDCAAIPDVAPSFSCSPSRRFSLSSANDWFESSELNASES